MGGKRREEKRREGEMGGRKEGAVKGKQSKAD